MVVLRTEVPLRGEGMTTRSEFTVRAGRDGEFYADEFVVAREGAASAAAKTALKETEAFWREWNGRNKYRGPYAEAVERSLMTLKAMTYRPSGGIVAAVTTSLPEKIGGIAQLGLSVLLVAGYGVYAAGADAGGLRR